MCFGLLHSFYFLHIYLWVSDNVWITCVRSMRMRLSLCLFPLIVYVWRKRLFSFPILVWRACVSRLHGLFENFLQLFLKTSVNLLRKFNCYSTNVFSIYQKKIFLVQFIRIVRCSVERVLSHLKAEIQLLQLTNVRCFDNLPRMITVYKIFISNKQLYCNCNL